MALKLHFSNSTQNLFEQFSIESSGQSATPFSPPPVITPNAGIHKWLQLRLAERDGIVFGLEKLHLERFIHNLLALDEDEEILSVDVLRQIIHKTILRKNKTAEDTHPLFAYLRTEEGTLHAAKTIQISTRLASLFLEYDLGRPGVYDKDGVQKVPGLSDVWCEEGKNTYFTKQLSDASESLKQTENWQSELFKAVFSENFGELNAIKSKENKTWLTLPALFRKRVQNAEQREALLNKLRTHPTCHLFSPSGMSHFHRNFILFISEYMDFHVYQLNPCSDFWEDVDTRRSGYKSFQWNDKNSKLKFSDPKNKDELSNYQRESYKDLSFCSAHPSEEDMRLLELWGQTGKENIALWCQAANYDFEYSEEPGNESQHTLLKKVQDMLLHRESASDVKMEQDNSLEIWQAPDLLRECEQLAENIYACLKADSTLKFQDIAVYVPDLSKYRPYLHLVFGRMSPTGKIPVSINDRQTGNSEYAKGAKAFMDLWGSNLSRKAVLRFLRNPLVLGSIGADREMLSVWESWIDQLNVFHTWNKEHSSQIGEKESTEIHTWLWGINRLLVGTLSDESWAMGSDGLAEEQLLPWGDMNTSDSHILNLFIDTLQTLYLDIQHIQNSDNIAIGQRVAEFVSIFRKWLKPASGDNGERSIQAGFLGNLQRLNIGDKESDINDEVIISTEQMKHYLISCLEEELPALSNLHAGSIDIVEMKPGSILPGKITFLLGMNGGDFPGQKTESTLNLMGLKRIIGDHNPVRQNQYLFLESLICTQQRLIMSYLGENIIKDEELAPSSVISELLSFLNQSVLKKSFEYKVVPLVAHEGLALGQQEILCLDYDAQTIHKIQKENPQMRIVSRSRLWAGQKSGTDVSDQPEQIHLSLKDIADFITEPKSWYLKKTSRISMYSDEGDSGQKEWERSQADGLQKWSVLDQSLKLMIKEFSKGFSEPENGVNASKTENEIPSTQQILDMVIMQGDAPDGILKDVWKDKVQEDVADQIEKLHTFMSMHKEKLHLNVAIGNIFGESADIVLKDESSNREYIISDVVPMYVLGPVSEEYSGEASGESSGESDAESDAEFSSVDTLSIIECSASKTCKVSKTDTTWEKKHSKRLILPWIRQLLLRSVFQDSVPACAMYMFDKQEKEQRPGKIEFKNNESPAECSEILLKILGYMYRWRTSSSASYIECPIAALWKNSQTINPENGFEELQYWIDEDSDKDLPIYRRPAGLKLLDEIPPSQEEYMEFLNVVVLPFLNATGGV